MPATAVIQKFVAPQPLYVDNGPELSRCSTALRKAFGTSFTLWDSQSGELVHASVQQPASNDLFRGQLARAIHGGEPQFIADEDCVLLLAVPLEGPQGRNIVATASFIVRPVAPTEYLNGAATLLGLDQARAMAWIARQSVWSPESLLRLATAVQAQIKAETRVGELTHEVDKLSDNLASTYEEICLLHSVTQNLRINSDEEQLCELVLRWLKDCLPAQAVAIQLLPVAKEGQITYKARTKSVLYTTGNCPVDNDGFTQLIDALNLEAGCGPMVANHPVTGAPDWPLPEVREVIVVPMAEGNRVVGWLAVLNHTGGGEFGTVEASLANSIGAILGIHSSNRDLYRQQSEFWRALSGPSRAPSTPRTRTPAATAIASPASACGWPRSWAATPRCCTRFTWPALLHDIGKIGIDDAVLRKPGKLTEAEFDHIKQHPELGLSDLADLYQLADVLPAVLHHHEQWDGKGYPFKLAGDQIPLIARILAVADAFDAMSSDRPYRRGMPVQRVEELFQLGAAQQWDAEVIKAYFTAHEDILKIAQEERANLTLDVQQVGRKLGLRL